MPLTYQKANKDVVEMLGGVMTAHHRDLLACEVKVDVLMLTKTDAEGAPIQEPALKVHGYPAVACIKVVPLKQRALEQGDALMVIDEVVFGELSAAEQEAVLDHELEHLQVAAEDGGVITIHPKSGEMVGVPTSDGLGRPKLKVRLHDWELGGFRSVVQRHGEAAIELKEVQACRDEKGQYCWDWEAITKAVDRMKEAERTSGLKIVSVKAGGKEPIPVETDLSAQSEGKGKKARAM